MTLMQMLIPGKQPILDFKPPFDQFTPHDLFFLVPVVGTEGPKLNKRELSVKLQTAGVYQTLI